MLGEKCGVAADYSPSVSSTRGPRLTPATAPNTRGPRLIPATRASQPGLGGLQPAVATRSRFLVGVGLERA